MDSGARYRFFLWVIVVLVALNLGSLGFLWWGYLYRPQPPQRDRGKADSEEFFVRELGLNEEQARMVHDLREHHFRKTDSLRFEISSLNRELMEELFDPSSESVRVQALSTALGEKHAEFERDVYEHWQKVKEICGPYQEERLKRMVLEISDRSKRPPPRGLESGRRPPP